MAEHEQLLTVEKAGSGIRLDRWLTAALRVSRSAAQRLIKEQRVTVDGKPAIPHALTKEGESIRILFPEIERRHEQLVPTVIKETESFLVIEKPAGLLVHATPRADETTLVDWLKEHDPKIALVGDPDRPGIVHRIDRDVSGLLVVAKTTQFYDHIRSEFQQRRVQKQYIALVLGNVAADDGEIRLRIARSRRKHGRMAARPEGEEGKEAFTQYMVTKRYRETTLLSVTITTGRTHQIRAHLFGIGHPIVGDQLYHPKHLIRLPPLDRLFLHAAMLAFLDLDGAREEFHSPLPEQLQHYLALMPSGTEGALR